MGTAGTEEEVALLCRLGELYIEREREREEPTLLKPEQRTTDLQRARRHQKKPDDKVRLNQLRGEKVTTIGFHDVYGELYDELGFDKILSPTRQKASARNLKHVVLARIAQPKSKRASAAMLEDRFGVEIALSAIYDMMDHLTSARIEKIKRLATKAATSILPHPVDVLFFDCTTLYFESFEPDALRQTGYSKDAKFKETQVVLALVVSQEGLPLTYELAPGSTYEGHTLKSTLEKLKTRFEVRCATVVADRGMLSEDNLKMLRKEKFHYVVGARLKSLKHTHQAEVLAWSPDGETRREFRIEGERLVVSHSSKRAARDAKQRQDMIAKLRRKLAKKAKAKQAEEQSDDNETAGQKDEKAESETPKNDGKKKKKPAKELTIGNRGYQRFLKIEGKYDVVVDEDKVSEAARWDGLHGVFTSLPADKIDAEDVLSLYHGLWQVEAAFRVTKHDLQVRPVYHWKPRRIEAHVAIAFMCLSLVRMLSYRVKVQQQTPMSEERIRLALQQTEVSTVRHKHDEGHYAIPMQLTMDAKRLYKLMGIPYHEDAFVVD